MNEDDLIETILTGKRRRFLAKHPIYHTSSRATEMELFQIAQNLNCKLTPSLSKWLLTAGYGDIERSLSFRKDWFCLLSDGPLQSVVAFAHDDQDNIYAYDPEDGAIYFVSSSDKGYARLADDFCGFLQELIKRNYDLATWRNSLELQHHGAADDTLPKEAA